MSTWKIITPIILIASFFVYFTVQKIVGHTSSVRVLNFPEQNICYLVSYEYDIKKTENGFSYTAGKNIGEVTFINAKLDQSYNHRKIGEFEAAYKKIKNFRMVQYKIGNGLIAFEKFQLIKKGPANLQPYQKSCAQMIEHHGVFKLN